MASSQWRSHAYINDAIVYSNFVFDGDANIIRASRVWELWNHTRPNAAPPMTKIQSYDKGYVTSNITDMQLCGNKKLKILTTAAGRKVWVGMDSSILTVDGPRILRHVGIGTKLLTVDCYKMYWGDRLKLTSHGNGRVRAFLRNHQIEFTMNDLDGTVTKDWTIYCHDFDTDGPIREGRNITYGLNNYREGVKELLGLPDASKLDTVVSIKDAKSDKWMIAFYVDGPENIILDNGLIMQSTQTPVRR